MTELLINGSEINNQAELHEKFSRELGFPEWYGKNLDALYDCLTDYNSDLLITIENFIDAEKSLGRYADLLKKVLENASRENKQLKIKIED